jgi:hypothetical protein
MASTLSGVELELEEEECEDGEEGDYSELLCGCGDEEFIKLEEDIVCVHLAMTYTSPDSQVHYMILQDEYGEPVAEPLFFRYECWENVGEELSEAVEDRPPWDEPGSVLCCDYCQSSIRMGEKCATVHVGEIGMSERTKDTTFISSDDDPYVICLPCVALMLGSEIDQFQAFQLWDGHIAQNNECPLCTQARCWRIGKCTCKCHVVPR